MADFKFREKRGKTTRQLEDMVSSVRFPLCDFSIGIFGAGGVGKTSLLNSFIDKAFNEKHVPTVDDYYIHSVAVDGAYVTVCIVDTAGTYSFPVMRQLALESCHGFIVAYALDSMASFADAVRIMEEITHLKGNGDKLVPVNLVANKLDIDILDREVTARQGHEALASLSRLEGEYIEASAKMNFRVEKVFLEVMRTLIKNNKERRKPKLSRMKLAKRRNAGRKGRKFKQQPRKTDCCIM